MRIISDFHDYYDRVQAHGIDKSLLYLREREELPEKESQHVRSLVPVTCVGDTFETRDISFFLAPFWLAVSGKVYRGVALRGKKKLTWATEVMRCFFSFDELNASAQALGLPDLRPSSPPKSRGRGFNSWRHRDANKKRTARNRWLETQGTAELTSLMITQNWTCLAPLPWWNISPQDPQRRNPPVILNPRLSDFEFFKAKDAFTVFQELSMWIGGVLPSQAVKMVTISDVDRLVKHGFDQKTSFRGKAV